MYKRVHNHHVKVLKEIQLTNSTLFYSPQAFKHNSPFKNGHYDTKSEPLNHAFRWVRLTSGLSLTYLVLLGAPRIFSLGLT